MEELDRRSFLRQGSLSIVAAAGIAVALPGLPALVSSAEAEAPAADAEVAGAADTGAGLTEPLVAHVRDLSSGEIGLYTGTRQVVFHDKGLATRLYSATR